MPRKLQFPDHHSLTNKKDSHSVGRYISDIMNGIVAIAPILICDEVEQ